MSDINDKKAWGGRESKDLTLRHRVWHSTCEGKGFSMLYDRLKLNLTIVLALSATAAVAQKSAPPTDNPQVFEDVIDCQFIQEPLDRLACYDKSVAKLKTAQETKELYVADKSQVQKAQKGFFGFSLPKIRVFDDSDENEITSISSKIVAVSQGPRGWIFELEDGAVWAQTDSRYSGRSPKSGQTLNVKRASLGSYMAKVDSGSAFRAERLNRSNNSAK